MYEELIKRLKDYSTSRKGEIAELTEEAADAIEELEKKMLNWQATADDHWEAYQHRFHKYMDDMPKWIPVTERLPKEDDDVLIYGEWTGASGNKYREIWLTDLKDFLHQGYKPIAWTPLPKPPKEGE